MRGSTENPSRKIAIYLSPLIQNEITEIIGKDLLPANLVKEINHASFFLILADEIEFHHVEQLRSSKKMSLSRDVVKENLYFWEHQ